MHSVTSNAVTRKIATIGTQVLLFNGSAYDGSTKQLNESYKNYRFLYIQLQTNVDYDFILAPTDNIGNNTKFCRTLMSASSTGQVSSFPYQSTAIITILSETSFKCSSIYTNNNWVLKVTAIWGVN